MFGLHALCVCCQLRRSEEPGAPSKSFPTSETHNPDYISFRPFKIDISPRCECSEDSLRHVHNMHSQGLGPASDYGLIPPGAGTWVTWCSLHKVLWVQGPCPILLTPACVLPREHLYRMFQRRIGCGRRKQSAARLLWQPLLPLFQFIVFLAVNATGICEIRLKACFTASARVQAARVLP